MGWFSNDDDPSKQEKKAAADRHAALKKAQSQYKSKEEDPTYRQLNEAHGEAAKEVPWWRR